MRNSQHIFFKKMILFKTLPFFSEKIIKAYNICLRTKLFTEILVYGYICLRTHLSINAFVYKRIYLQTYLSMDAFIYIPICLQMHLSIDTFVYGYIYLRKTCLRTYLSINVIIIDKIVQVYSSK